MEQIVGHDPGDPDTRPRAHLAYRTLAAEAPPRPPVLAFAKTARWSDVDADARDALGELVARLGAQVQEIELVPAASEAGRWQEVISGPEMAANLAREWATGRDQLSAALRARIERGRAVPAVEYLQAQASLPDLRASFTALLDQRYDAILTPTASGTAPAGLASTGEPTFCALWTLCGMPALSLPLLHGANGLPLGVQLVGPRHGDARLLRTARWLVELLERDQQPA
jgi:Asp-tRNA(Asn)/Glu-tRNA(Gln) amidotransferase A subunit family amidase